MVHILSIILGDVGGFMGLLLGGSVLTVFELMDLLIFNFFKKMFVKKSLMMQLPKPEVLNAKSEDKVNGSGRRGDGLAYIDEANRY